MSETVQNVLRLGQLGIILSIVSSLFTSSGLCLQKIVQKQQTSSPYPESIIKNPKYIAGISYVVIGVIVRYFIDILLPMSTMALLSAQSVVYTYILEYFFVNGPMDTAIVIALVLIVSGICLGTSGANIIDGIYSLENIKDMCISANNIVTTGCIIALLASGRQLLAFTAGGMQSTSGLIVSACGAGVVAAWLGAAVKAGMELGKYAFLHGSQSIDVANPWLWAIALVLAVLFSTKINVVDSCLAYYHHLQFIPMYQASAICFNSLYGIILFQDWSVDRSQSIHANESDSKYLLGLALVLIGLITLTFRFDPDKHVPPSAEKIGYHGIEERLSLLESEEFGDDNFSQHPEPMNGSVNKPFKSASRPSNTGTSKLEGFGSDHRYSDHSQNPYRFPSINDTSSNARSTITTPNRNAVPSTISSISKKLSQEALEVSRKRGPPSAALL